MANTLDKYHTAYLKAKNAYKKANSTDLKNKKSVNNIKANISKASGSKKAKLEKQLASAKRSQAKSSKKKVKAKSVYNSKKKTYEKYKLKEDRIKKKNAVYDAMKSEKAGYWKSKRPYIIPKYPQTKHSYVFIDNETETASGSTEITTSAIFTGQYINHYTQSQPVTHTIDGKLGGSSNSEISGLKKQLETLMRWCRDGIEVELHSQQGTNSGVITSVSPNYDEPLENAIKLSVTVQEINWANTKPKKTTKGKTSKSPKNKTDKPTKSGSRKTVKPKAGKYITIKSGDTYWGYHNKYGTSISKLRSWNGFSDTKLPIGKKCRVK